MKALPIKSTTVLQQLDMQKFLSLFKEFASDHLKQISWHKTINHFLGMFSWGLGTEFMLTLDSSLLVEMYNVKEGNRGKAIFHQKLPQHNLTLETAWPGLFVDKNGTYWDVPLSLAIDLASLSSDSGLSYHLCLQHSSGQPTHFGGDETTEVPPSLLPGLCAKADVSIKENLNIWRKKEAKLRMVQPHDAFLSEPHISASGVIGAVASVSLGDCSARFCVEDGSKRFKAFRLFNHKHNLAAFADLFASVSYTAQHGNFQRLFLDLTRLNAGVDIPSGSAFFNGLAHLAHDLINSRQPDLEALNAICPELTVSLQQQIIEPISFRVDSRILFDPKDQDHVARIDESIFAIDWALKVLGSAKATAWYSPKRREGMVELRFFES
ncbi:protein TRIGALACTOSYLDIACYLGLYCEROL 4, chloroplastic [Canna indica]|uniref:Protein TRIGALACTOSYLDIACYLGLYCEROL 4, chloroplastic n=1 Tax=Canna indica TaxID=4628 RepID=A0AAQ3KM10_9LILI|nr:protein TRIGALACTOSYLDIACYLGLYCEROL 4, chloroplastic [Canna indica]